MHFLIAGASGVTGLGATEVLEAAGHQVTTLSRSNTGPGKGQHISADLLNKASLQDQAAALKDISHVFYAALKPSPDPLTEATENGQMLENLIETLLDIGAPLERLIFLQGGKVYGAHLGVYKTPAREDDSRHFPPNLYFTQEDYARSLPERGVAWTALRPDIVIGHSLGSAMNLGNLIGVYGSLCKAMGHAMQFPGPAAAYEVLVNICDAKLLGQAVQWAAEQQQDGAFNITNGDQFRWKHVWPKLAAWFGVDAGEPQPISLDLRLDKACREPWEKLAAEQHLKEPVISRLGPGGFGDFIFHVQTDAVFDVTKARQAGFDAMTLHSDQCLLDHLDAMVAKGLIPKP
ncbi:SDR family oxidoreductase [Gallaecimonas mangrovi]|uniref:SDR family oxidoreductase n=1 Tax=Gallaecimonas mangrovi TaxID=2291597 RepID=UPI000E1FF4DC|nr:SDR family oxidoreductase [Gallaecimonas mangrovi]